MLLYSTTLKIDNTLTHDKFIQLVIDWNQNGKPENVIPNIHWNGERNVRYGTDELWLEIKEYQKENIIATRYEKQDGDGTIWNTDYVMNFNKMEMTIQLDRGYTEGALMENIKFKPPYFVTMLIENRYLVNDGDLEILRKPIVIQEENLNVLTDVIKRKSCYKLPVVYVSKTWDNEDPVNMENLCRRLVGAAHVLLEGEKQLDLQIREICEDENEYFGSIGVYYPNGRHKRFIYRKFTGVSDNLINKVVYLVLRYMNEQKMDFLETWMGVNNALLNERYIRQKAEREQAEQAREKAENDTSNYISTFDSELKDYQQRIDDLTRKNISLEGENQGLRAKLDGADKVPILYLGEEEEFFAGEIKAILLDAIEKALSGYEEGTRRNDVLNDIVKHNACERTAGKRGEELKNILKGYKNMSGQIKKALEDMGFVIVYDGGHPKAIYYGDNRYIQTLGATPSDHRAGMNDATNMIKTMF